MSSTWIYGCIFTLYAHLCLLGVWGFKKKLLFVTQYGIHIFQNIYQNALENYFRVLKTPYEDYSEYMFYTL